MVQVLLLYSFIYISCLVKQHTTIYYCFCMKHIMLCSCVCSSFPSCLSTSLIQSKIYFIDHQTANAIQLFVPIKRKFFGSLLFQNKLQRRGIPHRLLDKYSHLFICIQPLKFTLAVGNCQGFCWSKQCFHSNHIGKNIAEVIIL